MTLPTGEWQPFDPALRPYGERSAWWRLRFSLVLAFTMAISIYSIPALAVLSGLLIEDLGIDRSQYGVTVTVIAASNAVGAVLSGRLVDRVGGRTVLLWLLAATAMSALLLAVSPSFPVLLAVAALSGLPNGANNPATNKVIAEYVPPGRRGAVVGTKQSGVQAGMFLIGLLLPALALATNWRWALAALAAVALANLAMAVRVLPRASRRAGRGPTAHARGPLPAAIRWLVAYSALMGAGGAAVSSFLPLYAHESLGLSLSAAGAAAAVVGLVGMASRILLGRHMDRIRHVAAPLGVIAVGSAASVLAFLAAPVAGAWLWIGVAVAGVTIATWNAITMLAALSGSGAQAGRATGWIVLGFMGGYASSPTLFGAMVESTGGYAAGWWGVVGSFLAAGALMTAWWLLSRQGRPAAAVAAA
ncbi:MFS transporter [Blastococcus sp. SYSU D00820]